MIKIDFGFNNIQYTVSIVKKNHTPMYDVKIVKDNGYSYEVHERSGDMDFVIGQNKNLPDIVKNVFQDLLLEPLPSSSNIKERFLQAFNSSVSMKTHQIGKEILNPSIEFRHIDLTAEDFETYKRELETDTSRHLSVYEKLEDFRILAEQGNAQALELLYKTALHQTQNEKNRQKGIQELLTNSYYLNWCSRTNHDPRLGYTSDRSYYLSSSHNAYLQLARYYTSKESYSVASLHYAKAIQLTGFMGELPKIDALTKFFASSYAELTKRISNQAIKTGIHNKIHQIQNKDESIRHLIKKINECDYKSLFWDNDQHRDLFPYLALEGVKRGWVTIQQFSTVMRIWSLNSEGLPYSELQFIPLFDVYARSLIKETMIVLRSTEKDVAVQKKGIQPFLDDEGMGKIYELMEQALPSEQWILLLPDQALTAEKSISQFISFNTGFNVFGRPLHLEPGKRIVPSASLEIAFLQARYKNPCFPNLVLGASSVYDIRSNGLKLNRDMGIPFPNLPLPIRADDRPAPMAIDFIHHDFFHCYSSSEVGDHASRFILAADYIEASQNYSLEDKKVRSFWESFIDMDFPLYRHHIEDISGSITDPDLKNEIIFWSTVSRCAVIASNRSEKVNSLLKEVTLYLLQKGGANSDTLRKAADCNALLLQENGYDLLPHHLKWIFHHHPIKLMIDALEHLSE